MLQVRSTHLYDETKRRVPKCPLVALRGFYLNAKTTIWA